MTLADRHTAVCARCWPIISEIGVAAVGYIAGLTANLIPLFTAILGASPLAKPSPGTMVWRGADSPASPHNGVP